MVGRTSGVVWLSACLTLLAALCASIQPSRAENAGQARSSAPADMAAQVAKGRSLFVGNRCGECHALKDAGASGRTGPVLDGDTDLTERLVIDRVTNGSGPMPDFDDKLSDSDVAAIAAYLVQVARR